MSGETEAQVSGWTTDTLHSHILQILTERDLRYQARFELASNSFRELLAEMDRRYEQRFKTQQDAIQAALIAQKDSVAAAMVASDRALNKAEMASERRFEAVNEFRATLADQATRLMPRSEAQQVATALDAKVSDLTDRLNRSEGNRSGVGQFWAVMVAVIGLAIGLGGILLAVLR